MNRLYWWGRTDKDHRDNFGDILSPRVFEHFRIPFTPAKTLEEATVISIGSVARFAKNGDIVAGSGIIRAGEDLNPKADWRFVRGPLTRERVLASGGKCPPVYGDPALLLPLFCEELPKSYAVGIVPHYHYKHRRRARRQVSNRGWMYIDVRNSNPLNVASKISQCNKIVSSSLHGIIAAHAYGIPAAWADFGATHGDDVKFHDYYASVGMEAKKSHGNAPVYSLPERLDLSGMIAALEGLR